MPFESGELVGSQWFAGSASCLGDFLEPVEGFGDHGRVSLRFAARQPLAGRFNDSTGPIVVGNIVVVRMRRRVQGEAK